MYKIMDQFGSFVMKNRKPIDMVLIALILLHFAPTEVLGPQINSQVQSVLGPILTPIHAIMANVFMRTFLFLVLVWACCSTKDLNLFFLVALYFVVAERK